MQDRIRVAANAVVIQDGNVLLVEFSGGTADEHYNFPGGGVELGETLEDAVRREVMEEACLEVTVERFLLVVESIGSRNTNLVEGRQVPWNEVRFFFLCTPVDGSAASQPVSPDNTHQTAIRWYPLDLLPEINVLPQVSRELLQALRDDAGRQWIVANPHA